MIPADFAVDDAELSRCWSAWLVAREVGDENWRKFALNELRIAAMRAQQSMGVTFEQREIL